eukprot:CAMPEP_0177723312 /NCGR_PEP_ID=MMETSP0484_2-20121128/18146_1 /TAXON_ID=354590 /ORGANISM="Rhodomonas lens, Strain RHODO" /LENGTH=101 /DNA_ID=CAMNT_0019235741 /DNA_START=246 /DNA_END=550 /DNA_ORIENTATION=-
MRSQARFLSQTASFLVAPAVEAEPEKGESMGGWESSRTRRGFGGVSRSEPEPGVLSDECEREREHDPVIRGFPKADRGMSSSKGNRGESRDQCDGRGVSLS